MRTSILAFLIILARLWAGCDAAPASAIVLQAGKYTLTEDELQAARNRPAYGGMSDAQFAERLTGEARILAYALEHRFDTLPLLQCQLEYAMQYQVSSVNGYLWNRQVKPLLQVTDSAVRKAFDLRAREWLLECIVFPDEKTLAAFFPAYQSTTGVERPTAAAFSKLRQQLPAKTSVRSFSAWRSFPFAPLGAYLPALENPKVGDVWGPVKTSTGYYLVRVADQRQARQHSLEEEAAGIRGDLLQCLQEKKIHESQVRIMAAARPHMQEAAIAEAAAHVQVATRTWPGVSPGVVLMEYVFQGQSLTFTVADLERLVQCQPVFMGSLSNPADVRNMLESYLIGIYLFAEAQSLGIDSDPAYQLLKKQYLQGLYIHHYKQLFVYPQLSVTDTAVAAYYQSHPPAADCFDRATVVLYKFPQLQAALEARSLLMQQVTSGSEVRGVAVSHLPPGQEVAIPATDTAFSAALVHAVNKLEPGAFSMPVPEGQHVLVVRVLNKQGKAPLPLRCAAAGIRDTLLLEQERSLLRALEQTYPIAIDHLNDLLATDGQQKTVPIQ